MNRFRNLKVGTKLVVTFCAVVLPLMAAEVLALVFLRNSLRDGAELELTNVVHHLEQLCAVRNSTGSGTGAAGGPTSDDVEFLRAVIGPLKVGSTGYPYVMDSRGNLIVHPTKTGTNIYASQDTQGFPFIQSICDRAPSLAPGTVGTIRYPWKNEETGETVARMKILKFAYFRDWDWIIAAGSYEEEVFAALLRLHAYTVPLYAFNLLLLVALTWSMNRIITRPLRRVSEAAVKMSAGDLEQRVPVPGTEDEFGTLARSFNTLAADVRDKTENLERLVAERTEELRESRERYRSLVQSTVDGIVTTDLQGVITLVNQGFEAMLGYRRAEILGRHIWAYYPSGKAQARKVMKQLREHGNLTSYGMELIGKDRVVPIRTSATLLRDREGQATGTLGIFSDITAEKKLETDLKRTQAHLVQSSKLRALGDLVSGVAHEINNPLMASTTMLHVMEQADCPAGCPNEPRILFLRRCNERIARIVNHLGEFARQSTREFREVDLNQPVEGALLISGQQLLNLGVSIQKNLSTELSPILGDANSLEQALLDVISNARDAMEMVEKERVLMLSTYPTRLDGRPAVAVAITDTGPGILPEVRDKIFEPFFTTKEAGKGTGLGLSITYGIVEDHGGRIEVDSPDGGGTCVRITLPCSTSSEGD